MHGMKWLGTKERLLQFFAPQVLTPFLLAGRQQKNGLRLSFSPCESSEAGGKNSS